MRCHCPLQPPHTGNRTHPVTRHNTHHCGPLPRTTRRRPSGTDDPPRENCANNERRPGHPTPGHPRLRLVERRTARHRPQRLRHSISQAIGLAASWNTDLLQHVGTVTSTEARAKFNLTGGPGKDHPAMQDSPSGPLTSTFSVTHVGAAAWKPTVKTPTSPANLQ